MPEGGILTGPVWIGELTPGWHSSDCDLPAPGTQTLPEAFPRVGLCRATDAWELGGACVWVSGGHTMHTPEWPVLMCLWEPPLVKPSLPAEALGQSTRSLQKYLEPLPGGCSQQLHLL